MKLHGFKNGDNITIMNTGFKRFRDDSNKLHEVLSIVFKDLTTGQKYKEEIVDPDFTYYIAKPDKRTSYPRLFIPADDVEVHIAPHIDLSKDVAKQLHLGDWYFDCIKSGDFERAKLIHSHPDVFGTDINVEDLYRFEFGEQYQNNVCELNKAFFDIETDGIDMIGDFPQPGECPINAITIIDMHTMQVYTLLLRNQKNPQIAEFEKFIAKDMYKDLRAFIKQHVNLKGDHLYDKYKLNNLKFNMAFYDEDKEIDLIRDLFRIINQLKPDFVLAWNMAFDIPYVIQRIINLGYKPEDIMCHPDFKYKNATYYVDEKNKNFFGERGDFAEISSYSVFMDQLIQYASRRKGQTTGPYGLDVIGNQVAKIGKLDYKAITTSVVDLPYVDYKTFVYYNIMDTIVQYCIEFVTGDIDYTFGKALVNNTRYQKVHRQTTYLTNRGKKEFLHSDNLIIGNNFNKNNERPTTKFPGAFVADPMKVSEHSRLRINNRPINIFDNLDDFDYCIVA